MSNNYTYNCDIVYVGTRADNLCKMLEEESKQHSLISDSSTNLFINNVIY